MAFEFVLFPYIHCVWLRMFTFWIVHCILFMMGGYTATTEWLLFLI